MTADLSLALALADLADQVTLPAFRGTGLVVETKADRSPVTEIDRAAEQAIRDHLAEARPGDGVLGEEMGEEMGDVAGTGGPAASARRWPGRRWPGRRWPGRRWPGRRWIVDPLDGTRNYIRGIPVWATLIALESGGRLSVGVVSAPALGRRWWAERGGGAFADGQPIRVSSVARMEDATLTYSDITTIEGSGLTGGFLDLARAAGRSRAFGDFWSHALVAEGAVDVSVEPGPSYWDLAALQVIVEEAGGQFTDLSGQSRADGGAAVATNGLLHAQVLDMLHGRRPA